MIRYISRFTITTILFISLLPAISQGTGDRFYEAKKTRKAAITYLYIDIKGFVSADKDGKVEGLLVEVMDEFEKYVKTKYGITLNSTYKSIENRDFQTYLNAVKNSDGGVFGLCTTTIKEERKSFLKFSPAYVKNISVLVSHADVPTLSSMANIEKEFGSYVAYTTPGTTYEKRMAELKNNQFPSIDIEVLTGAAYEIVNKIVNNPNSFAFVDISYYLEFTRKNKPLKRHPVGDLAGEEYGIIMPLNSDWDTVLEAFMNSGFLKSSEYRQSVIKHLGKGALRMLD